MPLPSLVSAAQTIYNNEDLPYIRKANSVGIPEAVDTLIGVTKHAKENDKRVLALVDRLIHHSHIVIFSGESYRLTQSMQRQRTR